MSTNLSLKEAIEQMLTSGLRRIEGATTLNGKVYQVTAYTISRLDKSPLIRIDLKEKE